VRTITFNTADGALVGSLHKGPGPAAVLVAGSGPADRASLRRWVDAAAQAGLCVFAYDKPGCGESTGDWRTQDLAARATEVLAARDAVRQSPEVQGKSVALIGGSQGAWVALMAAIEDAAVEAIVCVSLAAVSVAEQELFRMTHQLPELGFDGTQTEAARAFLQRRIDRLFAGDDWDDIYADEASFDSAPWRSAVGDTDRASFDFDARIYRFSPVPLLSQLRSPLLAIWGSADTLLPAAESAAVVTECVGSNRSLLFTIPHADHSLRLPDAPDAGSTFPPGLWPVISTWLATAAQPAP
jgi:pimeloyl-ACP methyl ester carboxylesterase